MDKVTFFYPRWGAEHVDWSIFLDRVQKEGYAGIEWFPFGELYPVNYEEVFDLLRERNLRYSIVMTVIEEVYSFEHYLLALERDLLKLTQLGTFKPLFISAQVGREYYSFEEICRCIRICDKIEMQTGIPIYQETHRNKWSYGIHTIGPILDVFPNLKMTLDISHWYCVSESFLNDQQELLTRILPHVFHVHTRVGHTQASQVYDVSNPMYHDAVVAHLMVWQAYLNIKKKSAVSEVTMTTEFGPPPYLISSGDTGKDYEEQWRQNLWIKSFLDNSFKL